MMALVICISGIGALQLLMFSTTGEAAGGPVVKVRIETPAMTVDSTQVPVDGCTIRDSAGVDHVLTGPKAACALVAAAQQGGYSYSFDDFGWGLYLTQINGVISDASNYWLYRVNFSSPPVGLADYSLSDGDELLISYGPWPDIPLKATASSTLVQSGQTFTVASTYYDDGTGTFQAVADATVHLGTATLATDAQGSLLASLDKPGIYSLYIEKNGYVRSDVTKIEVPVTQAALQQSAQKGLDNLRSKQGNNGSIDNAGVSAWATVAFGSAGLDSATVNNQGVSLVVYLSTYVPSSSAKATDYSRQIMAALATGKDPRSFGTDLVSGLKGFYLNGQIGDTGLINDDVFAVLALLGSCEGVNQAIVTDSINYIVANQKADGGFGYSITAGASDVDTTAAAIEALALARKEGYSGPADLNASLAAAKAFLRGSQNDDGGFPYSPSGMFTDSNTASTAWAIQALAATGEDVSAWRSTSGQTPYYFLLASQNADGSFGWMPGDAGQNLMTAYTVPALLGQPLPVTYGGAKCSCEAPGLSLRLDGAEWASFADYLARTLTVNFSMINVTGGVRADNVRVIDSDNTNGVTVAASSLPLSLGSIDAGSSNSFALGHIVPVGVASYRATLYATAEDACGNLYEYPSHLSRP